MIWYSDGIGCRMYPQLTELQRTQLNKLLQTYFPLFLPPQAPGVTAGAAASTPLAS